jgi:hypothetical protein
VPGGGLDPLTPNSMRRGDTRCGTVLAGGGGCASSPTEGGGYWSAPSSSALSAFAPVMPRAITSAPNRPKVSGIDRWLMLMGSRQAHSFDTAARNRYQPTRARCEIWANFSIVLGEFDIYDVGVPGV